jgi:hypothetical protein
MFPLQTAVDRVYCIVVKIKKMKHTHSSTVFNFYLFDQYMLSNIPIKKLYIDSSIYTSNINENTQERSCTLTTFQEFCRLPRR